MTGSTKMHNMALIINNSAELTGVGGAAISVLPRKKSNTKLYEDVSKWMVIINNYEADKFDYSLDEEDKGYFYNISESKRAYIDYFILATGTTVNPVFSEAIGDDAATSVFQGFEIAVADGKVVVVNGEVVEAKANGLYDLSKFSGLKIEVSLANAKEMTTTTDELTGQELADLKQSGDVPEKDGYLFAGYYAEGSNKAMTEAEFKNADSVIAKFIPKAVLGVAWQISKGEAEDTLNLRLISSVDSLEYSEVRFTLVCGEKTINMRSTTVYTSINGFVDGEKLEYDPTIFSSASEYFMTHIVSGIPEDVHDDVMKVTATLVTKDGTVIDGETQEIVIKNATDYNDVMGK
jgi:hypothetical protein